MVLSSERSGRFEGKVSLMLRKLRGRYRERENVLVRCYDDPGILERFLEHHRSQRLTLRFGPLIIGVTLIALQLLGVAWDSALLLPVALIIVVMDRAQKSELHRVQSLRLMQHLRSQE